MLFDTLVLISLIIIIMLLRRLVNIYPSLLACIIRWKENVNLESSLKLRTDRNMLAAATVIPFCLASYRFGLYSPAFIRGLGETAGLGATIGVFASYILLRNLTAFVAMPRKSGVTAYKTANAAAGTFFIILVLLLLATGGVLSFFNADQSVIKTAMIWISAATYSIFLLRKIQIFASSYNFIAVFLYICALEILPTGVLIVSALIF